MPTYHDAYKAARAFVISEGKRRRAEGKWGGDVYLHTVTHLGEQFERLVKVPCRHHSEVTCRILGEDLALVLGENGALHTDA